MKWLAGRSAPMRLPMGLCGSKSASGSHDITRDVRNVEQSRMEFTSLGSESDDLQTVRPAPKCEWSQEQAKGRVHRLKQVKRQASGRGKFDLLKARTLHAHDENGNPLLRGFGLKHQNRDKPNIILHLSDVNLCQIICLERPEVARLEFQTFGVVKHSSVYLKLTEYPATYSPSSDSHGPTYPASSSTSIPAFCPLLRPPAARATTGVVFFVLLPSPSLRSSQQAAAVKVIFAISRKQQHFSKTPSELTSLIPPRLIDPNYLLEESSVNEMTHSALAWRCTNVRARATIFSV